MGNEHSCVDCGSSSCSRRDDKHPDFCISKNIDNEFLNEVLEEYKKDDINKAVRAAAQIENDYYCKVTRLEETIRWAKKMGAKKIGIATCVGLLRESRAVAKVLRANGFEVFGIGCKAGEVPKHEIGIDMRCEEVGMNMCNPVLQAKTLNKEKTDINIVMGLCVGHDSVFYRYSEALTTTLVAKDRVTGHNPAAPIYCLDSYYKKLLENIDEEPI